MLGFEGLILPSIAIVVYMGFVLRFLNINTIGEFFVDFAFYAITVFFVVYFIEMVEIVIRMDEMITDLGIFISLMFMGFVSPIILAYINYRHYRVWEL